jgi:hypothetical protein
MLILKSEPHTRAASIPVQVSPLTDKLSSKEKPVLKAMCCLALVLALATASFSSPAEKATASKVPKYDLTIRLDPEAPRMDVTGTMQLRLCTHGRETFELVLSDLMHDFRVEIVQPQSVAGPVELTPKNSSKGSTTWIVRPAKPMPTAEPLLIRFSYSGGEKDAFLFHLGPSSSFVGAQSVAWYPTTDELDGRGTATMHFSLPDGYRVIAPGTPLSTDPQRDNRDLTFELDFPGILSFAVGKYQIVRGNGPTPVSAYILSPHSNIQGYLDGCVKVLALLSKEFGPYPYGQFSIVELPHDIAEHAGFEGASFTGYILADSTNLDADFSLPFYGHEIGHQWWGNLITHKGERGNGMLDEAMAQLGALRVIEKIEGSQVAEQCRRSGYPGWNWHHNGVGYLTLAAAGLDHPLENLSSGEIPHELADSKGYLVLDLLSRTVGRDRYREILQKITRNYANQGITWEEFLNEVTTGAGRDLNWFYEEWFRRAGAPSWNVAWKQEGSTFTGIITQDAPFYQADLEVEITGTQCQRLTHTVLIKDAESKLTLQIPFSVKAVEVDPHYFVPHWTPEYRAQATALAPALHAELTYWSGKSVDAKEECNRALLNLMTPDLYGQRFLLEWILGQISMHEKQWEAAKTHFEAALASPSRQLCVQMWLYLYLAITGKELHDAALLRDVVNGATSTEALSGVHSGKVAAVRALAKEVLSQ